MDTITAKFTVNTPLFMSGADQTKAELRTPSIKGVIRFWWRALHYAEDKTLSALKKREEELFGSTRKQSSVRFALEYRSKQLNIDNPRSNPSPTWLNGKKRCVYLGYGVITVQEKLERPCIKHDQSFTLRIVARNEIDPSIMNAVKLFGLIGGAGAKSRKGYGSVTLVEMQRNGEAIPCPCPQDLESYGTELNKLLCQTGNFSLPAEHSFTAFSTAARIDTLLPGKDPIEILNNYGETMQLYRSWGRKVKKGHVLPTGEQAEHNFKNDHDWFKNENSFRSRNPEFHPERALFGLPHNYFKYDPNGNHLSANVEPAGNSIERRASPLFFHVHKLADKQYIGVSILLPALFLPGTERQISADGTSVDLVENNYRILTNFLEGKRGYRTAKTKEYYFPERKQIWPAKEEK